MASCRGENIQHNKQWRTRSKIEQTRQQRFNSRGGVSDDVCEREATVNKTPPRGRLESDVQSENTVNAPSKYICISPDTLTNYKAMMMQH
jgi:hypothetical protein